jgi:hypothetical protein
MGDTIQYRYSKKVAMIMMFLTKEKIGANNIISARHMNT